MKKYVLLITLLAMLLTACGRKPVQTTEQKTETPPVSQTVEQTPDTPPAPQSGESKPESPDAAQAAPARPEKSEQEFMVEGQKETVPATLYVGKGWSIYIPDEGWRLEELDREDGVFQTVWESTANDDAELWVLELGQRTREEAQTWLQREEDDYVFQTDKQGGLWGTDAEDRQQMEVRFHEGGGELYAVVWTYPEAAAEGFGTRLSVMADGFEITKE